MLSNKHFTQTFLRPPCAFFHVPAKKRLHTVILLKLCRNALIRSFVVLVIISSFLNTPAYSKESEDSQIFISGFNAFQQKDYPTTIANMNEVLAKYPDSPLRDMVLFWLSRAYFKNGNQRDAAKYMSQFLKEYPDNPLKGTVDDELLTLTARYDKGETLPTGSLPAVAQKGKAEQERLAKERAEQEKLAKQQAEQARLAAARKEQERIAAAKAEEQRQAAAAKAEQERLAAVKAEAERQAAVKAEAERQAAEKAAVAKRKAEEAEQTRLAAARKEQERVAALKAEEQRQAAVAKAEQERQAAAKAEQLKAESEKVDMEQVAKQQAELVRQAQLKAEQKRLAAMKLEEERAAAEKAAMIEQKRIVAAQAEEDRLKAEAEKKRLAVIKAEADRVAALKAEKLRAEQEKLERERSAAAAKEKARIAAVRKEEERKAAEKAQAERLAQEKIAMAKQAEEEAAQKRQVELKASQERAIAQRNEKERQAAAAAQQAAARQEQERQAAEKAAAAAEAARLADLRKAKEREVAAKAEEQRLTREREVAEKVRATKAALREQAIAQFKSILEKYPTSKAAVIAAAKLKELGVAVALPPVAVAEKIPENAKILRLEVAQFAGLEFNLTAKPQAYNVAQRVSIPFVVTNRGNGNDSFYLESGFPAAFAAEFAAAAAPDRAINQTTQLAPGESFQGVISLVIPSTSIDGLRINYPIKAASRLLAEATQSREVAITAAAPLLRALVKTDKAQLLPGEKALYRVTLLNVGSTAAQNVTLRLNFPPQLEPVDYAAAGFRQEMKAALVLDHLQIKSGESKEFTLAFQLKEDSLAGQELLVRAELVNESLKTAAVFVSNTAHVTPQHGVQVRSASNRQVVNPGQTFLVPLVVTNTGNLREKFRLASTVKGAQETVIFQDINRDGSRQANEPVVTEIGPLAPKEEASIVMEIKTPRGAVDGSQGSAQLVVSSEGDASSSSTGALQFIYSRPVLQMAMTAHDGRIKPGDVASFDLIITNHGSNLARLVKLQGTWPEQLELIATDPAVSSTSDGNILWKFKEVGAGEKRTIKVSYRVKPGTEVGTNLQVINLMSYEDQLGNRY